MLNVLITIDTEFWLDDFTKDPLKAINRRIYGHTPTGEFGIRYQVEMLNTYGLRATFFIDPLCFLAFNLEKHLQKITEEIKDAGHEIQLHIHTEWLSKISNPILPSQAKQDMKNFSEDEQRAIITEGLNILQSCGINKIIAFRAGNFGANSGTLRALAKSGILFDSSYNVTAKHCDIKLEELLLQPKKIYGIYEFPITFFEDFPKHFRPLQICACSSWEMENVLKKALKKKRYSVVIVSHSFELLHQPFRRVNRESPVTVDRFKKLCHFIGKNSAKFKTIVFSEIVPTEIPNIESTLIKSKVSHTAIRYLEQICGRSL
jgi:peptidoglycan/xylan/chitin deacetylase (PgdA/CDA1 family)